MEKYQGLPQEYCQQLHQLLEQLFNDCYRSLVGQADYIIDEHPAAEDIVMEVFKKVWERLTHEKIGKDELTEAYLKKAVRNGCLTWLDKRKNQTSLSRDISDPLAEEKTNEKEQWSLWLLIVEWM